MTETEGTTPYAYRYFMLRVEAAAGGDAGLAGVVERMTTGEKHRFTSREELLRLLEAWSCDPAETP